MLRVYEKLFGSGGVTKLFEDPDPAKGGTFWYLCQLADLEYSAGGDEE